MPLAARITVFFLQKPISRHEGRDSGSRILAVPWDPSRAKYLCRTDPDLRVGRDPIAGGRTPCPSIGEPSSSPSSLPGVTTALLLVRTPVAWWLARTRSVWKQPIAAVGERLLEVVATLRVSALGGFEGQFFRGETLRPRLGR